MNEYLITISDNKNNGNYSKLVDIPRGAQDAYICITKFQGAVDTTLIQRPNNVSVFLDCSVNSYANDSNSNTVVPSKLVDSFTTFTFSSASNGVYKAVYNNENNNTNWIKINLSSLSSFQISLKTCSNYVDLVNPISYVDLPNFPFTLQLKVKFE